MRRVAAGSTIALLACAACGGKPSSNDSAVQADRAAAASDTSGTGATMSTDSAGPGTSSAAGAPSGRPTRAVTTAPGASGATAGSGAGGPSNAMSIRPAAGTDTLRGIVRVVGASADQQPVLRPNGGGAMIALAGPLAPTLSKVNGADVWVSGVRQGTRAFNVDRFVVRAVGGVPAMDGTLVARDGGLAIMITGEHTEHPITNPPAALESRVGQRVWITGDPQKTVAAFGVIDEHP